MTARFGVASRTSGHRAPRGFFFVTCRPGGGFAFALATPSVRARVRQNLRRVMGLLTAPRNARLRFRTFADSASCFTEALGCRGDRPPAIDCNVIGSEHLAAALASRQGSSLVTAHTGGWEAAGPLLKKRFDLDVMVAMQAESDEGSAAHSRSSARTLGGQSRARRQRAFGGAPPGGAPASRRRAWCATRSGA